MSFIDGLAHRIRTLLRPDTFERDLADEMRFHEELDATQQRDAQRARRRFGNRTYYIEETRQHTWLGLVDTLRQDTLYAWRSLRRTPGFTILVVATFALGIGANSATFTMLDRLYVRPPAGVAEPEQLHLIWNQHFNRQDGNSFWSTAVAYPATRALREAWGDSSQVVVYNVNTNYRLGGTRAGPLLDVAFATANYFPVLRQQPQLGRFYSADEDRLGAGAPVAVLSDHTWRAHFQGDSGIVGRQIRLDEHSWTVIGVAHAGFTGIEVAPIDVWVPMASYPAPKWLDVPFWESPRLSGYHLFARAHPDMDVTRFEALGTRALRDANRQMWGNSADTLTNVRLGSIIRARGPGEQRQEHLISSRLSAVALIVLVIAAANVTNLLLARASRRRREIAIRLALGVSRARLVRMITTETMLLALCGAVAATLVAWWGGALLRTLLLPSVRWTDSPVDARVVGFTIVVAVVAGLLAGIVPGLQATRPQLTNALKEGAREGSVHRSRLRSSLIVAQAALSVTLLVGAALFLRSLRNIQAADIGFDTKQVIFAGVDFDPGREVQSRIVTAEIERLAVAMRSTPGVEATALAALTPMRGFSMTTFWFDDQSSDSIRNGLPIVSLVSGDFFSTTGLRVLKGKPFSEVRGGPTEAVVNDAMARQLWPGAEAIGSCLRFGPRDGACYRIVGIVEDAPRDQIVEGPASQFYLPLSNPPTTFRGWNASVVVMRASEPAATSVMTAATAALRSTFPTGYPSVKRMTEVLDPQYRPWRVGAALFTGFGVLALIVAVVGIYSTVSYSVTQRTHEFGVRVALGARVADVLRLVVGEGVRVVAVGVVAGVALALAAGRLISALLFGVEPGDPAVLALVSATLLVVAALAALVPAWRAARVDPVTALRDE